MIGFSIKKKKIITNKCSSLLLHLYLHLLHFLIMNKSSYLKKIKNNKEGQKIKFSKKKKIISKSFKRRRRRRRRRRRKFSKKALRLRALGSYFLVACKKKKKININQNFQFLEKFKISKIFKKNSSIKLFNSLKNSRFLILFFLKKKSLWIRGIGLVLLRQLKKKTKIFIKFFFRNRKL